MQREHGSLASLMRALPHAGSEINSSELDQHKVGQLVVKLAEATFEPQQILLYFVRSPGSEQKPTELFLEFAKGIRQKVASLQRVPFGVGKIGFVAAHRVEMTADDWANVTRTGGETVLENVAGFRSDLLGPMMQQSHDGDRVLGVLCLGQPTVRLRNEKMILQMITSIGSIAMMKALNLAQLRQQAQRDGLTGLVNKRQMMIELTNHIQEAEKNNEPLGLFIFDIDHFKNYNDTNGHLAGDELLKTLSKVIRGNLRPGDVAARYGGEEFVILMPNTDHNSSLAVAERLRRAIEQYAFAHEENQPSGKLTISGGVAAFPADAHSVTDLISNADQTLYQSKANGRNRVAAFKPVEFGDGTMDPYNTHYPTQHKE
jgi:diguanylate cyclase (GGDEF)-like protein